ncbi:hypothetical protein BJX99DRAFT_259006 [Aspergillus californicus]
MGEPTPVHFFDLMSDLTGPFKSWSANTIRIRMVLNYKNIPYTESYISYPDIGPLLSQLSVAPHPPGLPPAAYTLPAIRHPSVMTNPEGALMDSFPIALHLDRMFPSPSIFPSGNASYALALAVARLMSNVTTKGLTLLAPGIANILDPRGEEYFTRTRSLRFGKPLQQVRPQSEEETQKIIADMKTEMRPLVQMLKGQGDKSGPYFEGEKPGFADFVLVGFLVWFEKVERALWEELVPAGGGELKALWDACLPWVTGKGEEKPWEVPRGGQI